MKVTVDLDPKTVWSIAEEAEKRHVQPGDIARERLSTPTRRLEYHNRVRARVLAGLCDADIATELGRTVNEIARVRRQEQLPANPRYPRRTT